MSRHLHLGMVAALNVLLAFLSQTVIYTQIGPGIETDAFVAAATVPQMLSGMFAVAVTSVLVPLFAGEDVVRQRGDSVSLAIVVGFLFAAVALLLFLSASLWVKWLFPGFKGATANLCVSLLRVQIFSMAFAAMSSVTMAVLYARGQFLRVEVTTVAVVGLSVAALYELLPSFGIKAAAWVALVRSALLLVIVLPAIGWPATFSTRTPQLSLAWTRLKPILAGNLYYKTDVLVDRYLLSLGNAGELSLLGLAQQLYAAASSVIGKVWGATAIPRLSAMTKAHDDQGFRRFYGQRLWLLIIVPLAGYLALVLIGKPTLNLLLGHGRITAANVELLWRFMVLLGGVFVFGSAGVITAGAYYAIGDTQTPSYLGVLTFSILIVTKIMAFRWFGAAGICVATSFFYFVNAALQHLLLPRRLHALRAIGNI